MTRFRRTVGRRGVLAAGIAAAANTALFVTAKAAGLDFEVVAGSSTRTIAAGEIIFSSVVPVLLATIGVALLGDRKRGRSIVAAAAGITLLSLGGPLSMGVGAGTKATLAAMHVVTGAAFVYFIERIPATVGKPSPHDQHADSRHAMAAA